MVPLELRERALESPLGVREVAADAATRAVTIA